MSVTHKNRCPRVQSVFQPEELHPLAVNNWTETSGGGFMQTVAKIAALNHTELHHYDFLATISCQTCSLLTSKKANEQIVGWLWAVTLHASHVSAWCIKIRWLQGLVEVTVF